jgi:glycosyltransferase involved in cell wall biosynthesis
VTAPTSTSTAASGAETTGALAGGASGLAGVAPPGALALRPWPHAPLLLCASSSRTGPVEGLLSLGAFLRARGFDAHVAFDTVRPGEDLPAHARRSGVPSVPSLRMSKSVRPADVLHDARQLAAWARDGTTDLLYAAFAHDHTLCLLAARRAGRSREALRVVREAQRRIDVEPGRLGVRRRLLLATDGVVVRAERYRDALLVQGLSPERVAVIPGCVDASRFAPGAGGRGGAALALRRSWGVPDGAPLAGIVARMKPDRLHRYLLDAFAEALVQVPEAHLVLIGRGEEEARLRAQAARLAPERIRFAGYQRGPALEEAYRALDLAVWLREGNDGACRGVLEAMATGLPLLVGDDGAPPDLVAGSAADPLERQDGAALPCGLVVDPTRPAALTRALVELLSDAALRQRLGAAARVRAARFTAERMGESTLAFWQRLRALPPVFGDSAAGGSRWGRRGRS